MTKRFFLPLLTLCILALSGSLAFAVPNPQSGKEIDRATWTPTIEVVEINDHLLAFCDGRDISGDPSFAETYDNWVYWGAMNLGVCTYAIHQGDTALVYDTMPVPEQAAWVRKYLEGRGIEHFIVALSHWHEDHIGGNEIYQDSDIIAHKSAYEILSKNKSAIEAGERRGPPPVNPLILPNVLFEDRLDIYVGDIPVELHYFNIHSPDGNLVYLPADKILLSGDTLEDTITYVSSPQDFPTHVAEMKRLRAMDIEHIYPNHGSVDVIKAGGYSKNFIDATINYITRLVQHAKEKDFVEKYADLKTFIKEELDKKWIYYFEAYDEVHQSNLKRTQEYYKDKPQPKL